MLELLPLLAMGVSLELRVDDGCWTEYDDVTVEVVLATDTPSYGAQLWLQHSIDLDLLGIEPGPGVWFAHEYSNSCRRSIDLVPMFDLWPPPESSGELLLATIHLKPQRPVNCAGELGIWFRDHDPPLSVATVDGMVQPELIEPAPCIQAATGRADVNQDGIVNVLDAMMVAHIWAEGETP